MTKLIFRFSSEEICSLKTEDALTVLAYAPKDKNCTADIVIGQKVAKRLRQLRVPISNRYLDFLSIALSVITADTCVLRKDSDNNWCRRIHIELPVSEPDFWQSQAKELCDGLFFLSGDIWSFSFILGSYDFRFSEKISSSSTGAIFLEKHDSVCLFSGGLDSAIGAIDLFTSGRKPLLVSHAYKGDKAHQESILNSLKKEFGDVHNLALLAVPSRTNKLSSSFKGGREITMRTRSIGFLAFGLVASEAIRSFQSGLDKHWYGKELQPFELFVPENGFISINPPLTYRRLGSHSTKTTHPQFIKAVQNIFDNASFNVKIVNPYQFKTKGEMCQNCKKTALLRSIVKDTVSCSHWKRPHKQCGICVPCLIRRAALFSARIAEPKDIYLNSDIKKAYEVIEEKKGKKDDIKSVKTFIKQTSFNPASLEKKLVLSGITSQTDTKELLLLISRAAQELNCFLGHSFSTKKEGKKH